MLNSQRQEDTVERMKHVEASKRLETIRHLKECEDRTNRMQAQKKRILAQRKKAGVDAKMQREKIQAAMEKVKQTKKWHKAGAIMKKALTTNGSGSKSMKHSKRSKRSVMPSITTEEDALP